MYAYNAKTEGKENLLAHSMSNNIYIFYFECQLHFVGITECNDETDCIFGKGEYVTMFYCDGEDCPI